MNVVERPVVATTPRLEDFIRASSLPTLGGPAVEVVPAREPATPPAAWAVLALAAAVLLWTSRRAARTGIAHTPRRSNFRALPGCEGSVERMKPFPLEAL